MGFFFFMIGDLVNIPKMFIDSMPVLRLMKAIPDFCNDPNEESC